MNKSMKLYTKAINCYNEGYIEKALEYCERSISENLKNTSAINLKGLLYYLKGDLDNAQALWKMNAQVNKDAVSKKYLEDSKNDEEKKQLYLEALKYIKELKIREALQLLEKCKESDFNSININNCLALCYIKLGEYKNALTQIEVVLKCEKNNKIAKQNKKELIDIGVVKKEINLKYISIYLASMIILAGLFLAIKTMNKLYILNKNNKSESKLNSLLPIVDSEDKTLNIENQQIEDKKDTEDFPVEDINNAIESKDYETLNAIYIKWKDKDLSLNNKMLLSKTKELISGNGIEYFYNKGRQFMSAKDYNNSVNYLTIAFSFGEESYLYSHTIYLLAVSYKNTNDIEKAIKYYELYDKNHSNGDYDEAVLYDLALIYKGIDINKAKTYAEKLNKNYPKSIYNNSTIKGIIGS